MQSLHTRTAMSHADLHLVLVWDHFMNMGGIVGEVEVDAYLHGIMTLPVQERDCVAQAVNELLDDLVMTGHAPCCRAPYSASLDLCNVPCAGRGTMIGGRRGRTDPPRELSGQPIPLPLRPGSRRKR